MDNLIKRLEKRGWNKKEILRAINIIKRAKQNKPKDISFLDRRIYWVLLVIIVTANFAVSVALIPILVTLKGMFLYFIIITLGIVFGLLFELVIRSIEHLEKKHHFALTILIPLISLINLFVISNISNNLIINLNLDNLHNSMIIAFVYAVSFVLPYIIYRFVLNIEYYAKE
jgi:ABC-type Fe3+-siderophore transport system permease subunit